MLPKTAIAVFGNKVAVSGNKLLPFSVPLLLGVDRPLPWHNRALRSIAR